MAIHKEVILRELRRAIVSGEYKPGEHLSEKSLSKRFGSSRTPIRETLQSLEKEGLVTISPNAGARVIKLSFKEVSDIYDMLIVLEGAACRLACSKISDAEISKLEEHHFMMVRASDQKNLIFTFELNLKFHWLITETTRNSYLIRVRENFRLLVDRFARYAPVISGQVEATFKEHPMIIDALKQRNAALAEFAARDHMENAKRFMLGYFQEINMFNDDSKK